MNLQHKSIEKIPDCQKLAHLERWSGYRDGQVEEFDCTCILGAPILVMRVGSCIWLPGQRERETPGKGQSYYSAHHQKCPSSQGLYTQPGVYHARHKCTPGSLPHRESGAPCMTCIWARWIHYGRLQVSKSTPFFIKFSSLAYSPSEVHQCGVQCYHQRGTAVWSRVVFERTYMPPAIKKQGA